MRVALFADVHANLTALRAVLADIRARGPFNLIVSDGDQIMGGPRPLEVWSELRERGVTLLRGNVERDLGSGRFPPEPAGGKNRAAIESVFYWTLEQVPDQVRAAAAGLPAELKVEMDGAPPLVVAHANRDNLDDFIWEDTPPAELRRLIGHPPPGLLVLGHVHAPLDMQFESTRIVRPGSVALKYEADVYNLAHWAEAAWDTSVGAWTCRSHVVAWDHRAEIEAAYAVGYPGVEILPGFDRA